MSRVHVLGLTCPQCGKHLGSSGVTGIRIFMDLHIGLRFEVDGLNPHRCQPVKDTA